MNNFYQPYWTQNVSIASQLLPVEHYSGILFSDKDVALDYAKNTCPPDFSPKVQTLSLFENIVENNDVAPTHFFTDEEYEKIITIAVNSNLKFVGDNSLILPQLKEQLRNSKLVFEPLSSYFPDIEAARSNFVEGLKLNKIDAVVINNSFLRINVYHKDTKLACNTVNGDVLLYAMEPTDSIVTAAKYREMFPQRCFL